MIAVVTTTGVAPSEMFVLKTPQSDKVFLRAILNIALGILFKSGDVMEKPYWSSKFWARVAPAPNGCLEWQAGCDSSGYGMLCLNYNRVRAHVASFRLTRGYWPTKFICHTCDNPPCADPFHLFEGTCKENIYDAISKGRFFGRPHSLSIETRDQIRAHIGVSQRELARIYGTTQSTISEIKRGLHEPRRPR